MEVTRSARTIISALVAGAIFGCGARRDDAPPADTRAIVQSIGRRLSRSYSEHDLSVMASRGDLLLPAIEHHERSALARRYLRFFVESAVTVDVAVPVKSVPFWIADQAFQATNLSLQNGDTPWALYRKRFEPGWIGLGVNGLDMTPVAHYVVFVRRQNSEGGDSGRSLVTLETTAPAWKIVPACQGVSAAYDVYRPFAALPPELVNAVMLQPAQAARHSMLLATGRVWKTHVVAGPIPDQFAIAFGADPARELVWTWRTSVEVAKTVIRIAPLLAVGDKPPQPGKEHAEPDINQFTGDSSLVEVANVLNDPVIRRHRVRIDNLAPNSSYRYSLGDGDPGRWTPWRTVKTGPDRSRGVRFMYLGDAQTGLENWGRLLASAYRRHPEIDFILLAGDLVDRGNERTNWDHFFMRAQGVFDRVPLMPCAGNHEYLDTGPRLYRAFFELPRNGPPGVDPDLVYHFECGDTCVAILDSTMAVSDRNQAQRQADWLDATLARSKASWKIVAFHHPVYPSHPWRKTPFLREHWVPIFDKHHVDLVLQGHDHAYLRTFPMRANQRVAGPCEGTTYVIAVSGDKFVDQAHRDFIEAGHSGVATYQIVDIDASARKLTLRAFTQDGNVLDEFVIDRAQRDDRSQPAVSRQRQADQVRSHANTTGPRA